MGVGEILGPIGLVLVVVVATAVLYFVVTAIKGRRSGRSSDWDDGNRFSR